MFSCNAADRLYRLVPLRPWRAWLTSAHFERCPACQKQLASAAEARSLFVQESDSQRSESLWDGVARTLAESDNRPSVKPQPGFHSRAWRWAAAGIVLVVLAGYWVRKDFRPEGVPASAPARFELDYVRVGGLPADAYIYEPQGSDIVIVWAGKPN